MPKNADQWHFFPQNIFLIERVHILVTSVSPLMPYGAILAQWHPLIDTVTFGENEENIKKIIKNSNLFWIFVILPYKCSDCSNNSV